MFGPLKDVQYSNPFPHDSSMQFDEMICFYYEQAVHWQRHFEVRGDLFFGNVCAVINFID